MATQSRIDKHINLDKAIAALTTDKVLKVGWTKNIRYPEDQGGAYVAEIAAQNEYGAPHKHIPPRPFMAPAVAENKNKWMRMASQGAKRIVKNETNILDILDIIGVTAAADVKKSIRAVTSPALSPITIANRESRYLSKPGKKRKFLPKSLEKPLIDTSIMFDAVSHVVEPG